MAEISPELLISIRQFAVDTATEVAKITDDGKGNKGTPNGLLPNAQSIEHFILTGNLPAAPDQQPNPKVEAQPVVRSRKRAAK